MKIFWLDKNQKLAWQDRRIGEIAIRYIFSRFILFAIPVHISRRLKKHCLKTKAVMGSLYLVMGVLSKNPESKYFIIGARGK